MNTQNSFGCHFIIRQSKAKNGLAPIFARVTVNSKRAEISIKQKIKISDWNKGKSLAKGSSVESKKLNLYLNRIKSRLLEIFQELNLSGKLVTVKAVKDAYSGNSENGFTLRKLFEIHRVQHQPHINQTSQRHYRTTTRLFLEFLKKFYQVDDLSLNRLTYSMLSEFKNHISLRVFNGKRIGSNTVNFHTMRMKAYVHYAQKLEWIEKDPFLRFKIKFLPTERGYLTEAELLAFEHTVFKSEQQNLVKDLFLFCCYTGLAFGDLYRITEQHLAIGMDGKTWIHTHRHKTKAIVRVPLLQKAKEIIEKYRKHPLVVDADQLFPFCHNNTVNKQLKDMAIQSGIAKRLTFHMSRHTFATTVTLSNGMPIETVSKLLGHSNLRVTQVYAKVLESKISADFSAIAEKFDHPTDLRKAE